MVCPICNSAFYNESGKCPNCDEYVEIICQRQKLNDAIYSFRSAVADIFKSKRFLTYCIILSIACGCYALAFFYEIPYSGFMSAATAYGLYIGFGIVSVSAVWKLRSQTSNEINKDLLGKMNAYPKLWNIMSIIGFVFYIIGAALAAIVVLLVAFNMNFIKSEVIPEIKAMVTEVVNGGHIKLEDDVTISDVLNGIDVVAESLVFILIAIVIFLTVTIIIMHYKKKMYKGMTEFISNIESTSITFAYIPPSSFSSRLLTVIGIIDIITSVPAVLLVGAGALAPLMQGVWLIVTAKLFSEINVKLTESSRVIFEERRILENMVMYYRHKEEDAAKNAEQNETADATADAQV